MACAFAWRSSIVSMDAREVVLEWKEKGFVVVWRSLEASLSFPSCFSYLLRVCILLLCLKYFLHLPCFFLHSITIQVSSVSFSLSFSYFEP